MVNTIFTIGYSGFEIDEFLETLRSNRVSCVIDVRSLPYSHYYSDYNKEHISKMLRSNGIYYRNYISEFGARQEDVRYYPNGYLDFTIFSKSRLFLSGIDRLKQAMQENYTFALMCSEKDPVMCHRSILVARAFYDCGYNVIHLLPNRDTVTQGDIELRLLNKFFPDREKISLLAESLSIQEYIDEAYKKQNAIIGYALEREAK